MSVTINTNIDALRIQNNLTNATAKLSSSMQRMSTGLKVNSSKDDAAGCVIAAKMEVQLNGNKVAQQNVQNANAMLSTAEGNLDVVQDNLVRIRDLVLQAKNGTYTDTEITAMKNEVDERIKELTRICTSSKYSSLSLFNDTTLQGKGVTYQVGSNKDADNTIKADGDIFNSVTFEDLTDIENFDLAQLSTGAGDSTDDRNPLTFTYAIGKIDNGINKLTTRKSEIGSAMNRLDSALNTLTTQYENLSSAKSIIMDADIASEASTYTQQNILQQVSTSLLAQANQSPSIALSLI
jgi:flagellin